MNWLKTLEELSPTVSTFVNRKPSKDPDDYQVKWYPLRFVFGFRLAGKLKYLPDKSSIEFSISLN